MQLPTSRHRPNIISAPGKGGEISVGDRILKDGENVILGVDWLIVTNASNLMGYNWMTDRVLLKGCSTWVLVEEWMRTLSPDEYAIIMDKHLEVTSKITATQTPITPKSFIGEKIIEGDRLILKKGKPSIAVVLMRWNMSKNDRGNILLEKDEISRNKKQKR